jgi:RNA polymerase sigma-70 factor, ECF subfamily
MSHHYSDLIEATEEQLVELSIKGDLTAYDEIVRRYQQSVASSLYRFCGNHADLEDLVQETFIRAYSKLHKWVPKASLISWIRKIGYNLSYDFLRKQKRNPLANRSDEPSGDVLNNGGKIFEVPDSSMTVDQKNCNNDLVRWLLSQLSADEAMVVSMFYLDQLSIEEIAERTGWSLSNVKVKAHRTRKKLKHIFDENEGIRLQYSSTI